MSRAAPLPTLEELEAISREENRRLRAERAYLRARKRKPTARSKKQEKTRQAAVNAWQNQKTGGAE